MEGHGRFWKVFGEVIFQHFKGFHCNLDRSLTVTYSNFLFSEVHHPEVVPAVLVIIAILPPKTNHSKKKILTLQ